MIYQEMKIRFHINVQSLKLVSNNPLDKSQTQRIKVKNPLISLFSACPFTFISKKIKYV